MFCTAKKVLVMGHDGHGKKTAAAILASFGFRYTPKHQTFSDHSEKFYRRKNARAVARRTLIDGDICCGLWTRDEYLASSSLFNLVLWIKSPHQRSPTNRQMDGQLTTQLKRDARLVVVHNVTRESLEADLKAVLTDRGFL